MKKVIYQQDGELAVIHPTGNLSVIEVARKDVPKGCPYIIIDDSDLPEDRIFRGAWEADFSSPDGYGIGAEEWFAEQEALQQQEMSE